MGSLLSTPKPAPDPELQKRKAEQERINREEAARQEFQKKEIGAYKRKRSKGTGLIYLNSSTRIPLLDFQPLVIVVGRFTPKFHFKVNLSR